MYTISDRGRALCVLSAEHEALQQQAFQTTYNMRQAMKRFSDEHKNILKKMRRFLAVLLRLQLRSQV